jgi:capsular polysaccharide transport system permease protein
MLKALKTQLNVVAALTIRDMQRARKSLKYGYAWSFLQIAVTIVFFRLIMSATGLAPAGMGATTFLIQGVFITLTFLATLSASSKASRRGLCILPRVTPLDLFLAKGFLVFVNYSILFWAFAIPAAIYDGDWPPENPLGVQAILIANWLLALGLGYAINTVASFFPAILEFKKFFVKPMRYISGMFFVISSFPTWIWPYLTWNPVLHCSELMRSYWFTVYTTPVGSLPFVLMCIAGLTLLGLSLEHYMRRVVLE